MDLDKNRLERLKRSLYSRNESVIPKEKRDGIPSVEYDVKNNWGAPPSFDLPEDIMTTPKENSFFKKFLIVSVLFFLVAAGVAAYMFFGGSNVISSDNLDIKVIGPSSIASGETLDLGISIVNKNRVPLEKGILTIEYPTGTQSLSNSPLTREKIELGTLEKGVDLDKEIKALIFGEKGATRTIKFTIDYTISGSNATFSKTKTYELTIDSSPFLLSVMYPKEINSGQEVKFEINVTSNSGTVIKNSMVKIEYPYGFTFKEANIKSLKDNAVWNLGDLKGGDKKTLTIKGILVGQDEEDRSFRISVGTPKNSTDKDFDVDLAVEQATISIKKSFFGLNITTGREGNIGKMGSMVPVTIKWSNTLPDKVTNSVVVAKLSGNVFDRTGVSAGSGYYRSSDLSVTWDKNMDEKLSSISPGDGGEINFSVSSLPNNDQVKLIKNPYIKVFVTMTGYKTGEDSGNISSDQEIMIKFPSVLSLTSNSYRSAGPLTNTGPIPPKVDIESTYTITWTLTNTSNDLSGAKVSATLPVNVEWKNEISPSSTRLDFNPDSRVITWTVGNISAGSGFSSSPKTVSFKVGIIPNATQVGDSIELLSGASVSANDTYTDSVLNVSTTKVSTRFADPNYKLKDEAVVK